MKLTKDQCKKLIDLHKHPVHKSKNINDFKEGEINTSAGLKKSRIDYQMSMVERTEETQWFFDIVGDYLDENGYPNNTVRETAYFNNFEYYPGMKFERHIDKHRMDIWEKIVGGVLNEDFEGGRLIYYNPDFEIPRKAGEIYLTDASLEHEVTKVTKGKRYSWLFFLTKAELGIEKTAI